MTISSATSGATIRYTTDGSMPSETNGTIYSGAFNLNTITTLKAIAYQSGLDDSAVTNGLYTVGPRADSPTFSPAPGSYSSVQTVMIASSTPGAFIAYTTDGSIPTESGGLVTHGTLYSAPVSIFGASTTLNAIAFASDFLDSATTSGLYTNTNPPPLAPVFSSQGGTFASAQTVTIMASGATTIYYTTDGSIPTNASILYTSGVPIANNTVLQAIGVNGGGRGPVAAVNFTILPPAPTFNPSPGTYAGVTTLPVTISDAIGAPIYYTTDGTTPTNASTLYTAPVSLSLGTTTLSAIAINANGSSTVIARQYVLTGASPQAPVLSLPSGTYSGTQSVTISSVGSSSIYYTTDGSTPTTSSTNYAVPVSISASTTLKVIALNGAGFSPVTSSFYTIVPAAATPVFSPVAGTYSSTQLVTITSATSGASIRYTTDGSVPSGTTGTIYTGPVSVNTTEVLKAVAYKNGFADSSVVSGTYTINGSQTAAPIFSPGGGNAVTITSATPGALIRFTVDGSPPTETNGALYTAPVPINTSTTLKAIAYVSGLTVSPVTSVTIGIPTVTIVTPAEGSTINN